MRKIIFLLLFLIGKAYAQTDAPPLSPVAKPLTSYFNISGSDSSFYAYINGKFFQVAGRAYLRTNVPFLNTKNAFTYTNNSLSANENQITITGNYTAQANNITPTTFVLVNNTNLNGHTGVNPYALRALGQVELGGLVQINGDAYLARPMHANRIDIKYDPTLHIQNKLFIRDTVGNVIMTSFSKNHEVHIGTDTVSHGLDSGLQVGGHVRLPHLSTSGAAANGMALDSNGNVLKVSLSSGSKIVYISQFAVVPDSITDNTTAIRAAIAATPIGGELVFDLPGKYLISDSLLLSHPITIEGVGGTGSGSVGTIVIQPAVTIITTSTTKNVFVVNSNRCRIENIGIWNTGTGTPTAGHGILLNKSTGYRQENVTISYFYINEEIVNGYLWDIHGCLFNDPVVNNLIIRDVALPDGGDQFLHENWFFGGKYANIDHILYTSGGGLHATNNKFNTTNVGNDPRHCFNIQMHTNTVDNIIAFNSMENFNGSALRDVPDSGVTYTDIHFIDNQITPAVFSSSYNLVQIGDTLRYPSNIIIDGNIFHTLFLGTGTGNIAHGYHIWAGGSYTTIGSSNQYFVYGNDSNENIYLYNTDHLNMNRQSIVHVNSIGAGMTYDPAVGINQVFNINTNNSGINIRKCYPSNFKLYIVQDSVGGHKVIWDGSLTPIVFTGSNSINTLPHGVTVISGYYDNTNGETVLTIENAPFVGTYATSVAMNADNSHWAGSTCYNSETVSTWFYNGTTWIEFNSVTFGTGLTKTGSNITNDAITGKPGGQTIVGGTAASDNLILTSTTNGTKGIIRFGGTSAYDETDGRIGINTLSPIADFDNGGMNSTNRYQTQFGSWYHQTYSVNNLFWSNNAYYNAGLTRVQSGYAFGIRGYNGTMMFWAQNTGSGAISDTYGFKYDFANGNTVALGGNIDFGSGSFGGASLIVDGSSIQAKKAITLQGYTVSTLPTGVIGMTAYVTDALTPVALGTVVGGGSSVVPVFFNGTNWIVQ